MTEKDTTEIEIESAEASAISGEATLGESENQETAESDENAQHLPLAEIEKKLAAAEEAQKAEHDRFLRLYAEFDNYKKRNARDMQEFRKYACESLVREFLPAIDNLDRALHSSKEGQTANGSIVEGVELIFKEMLRILERFHVKPVESLGKAFNPAFHEAIGQEISETEPDNTVVREFQKGYTMHERLIRPAMVIVSKAKPKEQDTPQESESEDISENSSNDTSEES
jgi:molecular chaperone GrpE